MKTNKKGLLLLVIIAGIVVTSMFVFLGFVLLGGIFGDDRVLPNVINGCTFGAVIIYILILSFYINQFFLLQRFLYSGYICRTT